MEESKSELGKYLDSILDKIEKCLDKMEAIIDNHQLEKKGRVVRMGRVIKEDDNYYTPTLEELTDGLECEISLSSHRMVMLDFAGYTEELTEPKKNWEFHIVKFNMIADELHYKALIEEKNIRLKKDGK